MITFVLNVTNMIKLNVLLVPAPDIFNPGEVHTAYTVYTNEGEDLWAAGGWTLRDAITLFAKDHNVSRSDLIITRPFTPQIIYG